MGGCTIGQRPVDFHYRGFARLGASVEGMRGGGFHVSAQALEGAFMYCDVPSHTGVENLVMAASLARGESIIENAASDPEIEDFALLMAKMGARVEGIGSRTVRIQGVEKLRGAVGRYPSHVILAPYPGMKTRVALTAWGRIDTLEEFDEKRIVRFIEAYRGIDHHR